MKVNDYKITQDRFAYDGCHKIYLIGNTTEQRDAMESGYTIHSIYELERIYEQSDSLRFISTWDLTAQVVKQCEQAIFKD